MAGKLSDKFAGVCFYTHQASLYGEGIYLSYGSVDSEQVGQLGLPTAEVGKLVKMACEQAGLAVGWDGNPDQSIYLKLRG